MPFLDFLSNSFLQTSLINQPLNGYIYIILILKIFLSPLKNIVIVYFMFITDAVDSKLHDIFRGKLKVKKSLVLEILS